MIPGFIKLSPKKWASFFWSFWRANNVLIFNAASVFICFVGLAFSGKSSDFVEEDGLIPFTVPCQLPLAFIVTLIIIGFEPMVDHFAPESFAPRIHFSAFIVKSLLMSTT